MIQGFLGKFGKNRERFDEMETEAKMQKLLQQKGKNSNERELERFEEEQRQRDIKNRLQQFRELRKVENRDSALLKTETVFNHKSTVLEGDNHLLENKNMFMSKGNMF